MDMYKQVLHALERIRMCLKHTKGGQMVPDAYAMEKNVRRTQTRAEEIVRVNRTRQAMGLRCYGMQEPSRQKVKVKVLILADGAVEA